MAIHPFARGPSNKRATPDVRSPHVSVSDLDAVGRRTSAGRVVVCQIRLTALDSHPGFRQVEPIGSACRPALGGRRAGIILVGKQLRPMPLPEPLLHRHTCLRIVVGNY
jgi:hypothetical protein